MSAPSMLDAALAYAKRGWPVFPCNVKTKAPLIPKGFKAASTDPDVIREWWKRWPNANIGIPTGEAIGAFVLDIDDLKAFRESIDDRTLPDTRIVTTGKGLHYHFSYVPGVRNGLRVMPGADIRGNGGYVIAPPSIHANGKRYAVTCDKAIAEAPQWLRDMLLHAKLSSRNKVEGKPFGDNPFADDTAYGLKALRDECDKVRCAGEGTQEATLNTASLNMGALVAGGELRVATARERLIEAGLAMEAFNPDQPWTRDQIIRKVERALTDGAKHPRSPKVGRGPEAFEDLSASDGARAGPKIEITATPFGFPEPAKIPRRRWLFGKWLLRGEITAIIAVGGAGKSTLGVAMAVSLASGHTVLGKELPEGAQSVWVFNLEDDKAELDRQITAALMNHGIGETDCGGRLFIDSGLDQPLCTATETPSGIIIAEPVFEQVKRQIKERGIGTLIIDPFVSSHAVSENDNRAIDQVAKRWKRLAKETGCAIVLIHHSRKLMGREATVEDSRGASALVNAARIALTLNTMTKDEADKFGIPDDALRKTFVRIDNGKSNRAPAEDAWWMKLTGVELENGDWVAAASHWTPPDAFAGITCGDLYKVQMAISKGQFRENVQAKDWAGLAVAEVLGLDSMDAKDRKRILILLKGWKENGALTVVEKIDAQRRPRPFLEVGIWACSTAPLASGAGCSSGSTSRSTTTPIGGGAVVVEQGGELWCDAENQNSGIPEMPFGENPFAVGDMIQ